MAARKAFKRSYKLARGRAKDSPTAKRRLQEFLAEQFNAPEGAISSLVREGSREKFYHPGRRRKRNKYKFETATVKFGEDQADALEEYQRNGGKLPWSTQSK